MKSFGLLILIIVYISPSEECRSVCYDRVGCFDIGAPFFCLQRPINLLPQSPDKVLTKYFLSTRDHPQVDLDLDARHPDNFTTAWPHYKVKPTKIIVHGFLDSIYKKVWENDTKDALLINGDYNVILVDWHHGNRFPYTQATGNTRLVGAQIADLISTIHRKLKQSYSDFHIIGHSLGAHIAGYAGEIIPGLGRITGLDPAGPYFSNTDPKVRLDPSDANLVDVIHTNTESFIEGGVGTPQPEGHADFYPNLGHNQPACDTSIYEDIKEHGVVLGTKLYMTCEHTLSQKLFIESITSVCPFTAFPCANEVDYAAGKCHDCSTGQCGRMGFHATRPTTPTKYFMYTLKSSPYCAYNFLVTVALSPDSPQETGHLQVQLTGVKGVTQLINLAKEVAEFRPGGQYNFTVPTHNVGQVTSLKIGWHQETTYTDVWKWNPFGLRHPSLTLEHVTVLEVETNESSQFCLHVDKVESDKIITLQKRC